MRQKPLIHCTDQELAAEWSRIFGRNPRPPNRRSVINRLTAAGNKKRLTPEEYVENHRAFMAAHPTLGIDADAERALAECQPYIVGFDLARGDDKGFKVTRKGDTIVSVTEIPPSAHAAETQAAPTAVSPAPKPFRKYGRSN